MPSPQMLNVLPREAEVLPFKPRLKKPKKVAHLLAVAEAIAADPATSDQRRAVMHDAIATYRRQLDLAECCRRCGRHLSDPVSIARRIGSECVRQEQAS